MGLWSHQKRPANPLASAWSVSAFTTSMIFKGAGYNPCVFFMIILRALTEDDLASDWIPFKRSTL